MANQPTKYRKFIVGAASAALVASAVAPVASAAEFSDVSAGNSHKASIDALVAKGVISGYPDGTFKPNQTLTRSDVVKMMGKWLKAEGYQVPADYKTNPRFTDLKSTSNDELLQMAALVKDNGLFVGKPDGTLDAAGDITRENMAIVLVRAFDRVHDIDLATYVAGQDFKKDVNDLGTAKAEARPAIDVLDYFDITNPAAPAFNPKGTTTRAQFASFLNKAIETDYSEVGSAVAPNVAGIKAINATTVEVTFKDKVDNINSLHFSIDGLTVSNAAVKQTDDKTVVLTTAVQKGGEKYTVTLNEKAIGSFEGISAVIPTAITMNTTSVQSKVGNQVILSASIGVKEAGVPVTFNVDAPNGSLNKDQIYEVYTDADGIATFSYTQYAADMDTVFVYPTGNPSVRSHANVYWGVEQILTIEDADDKKGTTLTNGEKKVYKVTFKHPKTGAAIKDATLNVTFDEHIGINADKLQNVTVEDPATGTTKRPHQLANGNVEHLTIKTDSNGVATFNVTGTNAAVTPIVFVDGTSYSDFYGNYFNQDVNARNSKLDSTELQAKAAKLTFTGAQVANNITLTAEGSNYAATGDNNGRVYKLAVTDKDGKAYANGIVNVALNEDLDKNSLTKTSANIKVRPGTTSEPNKYGTQLAGKNDARIQVKLNSKGEAELVLTSNTKDDYATPIVWIDQNTSANNQEGTLEVGEPSKLGEITYFEAPKVQSSKLEIYKGTDNDPFTGVFHKDETAEFRYSALNQSGKVTYEDLEATFEVANNGGAEITVQYPGGTRTIHAYGKEVIKFTTSSAQPSIFVKTDGAADTNVTVNASAYVKGTNKYLGNHAATATFTKFATAPVATGIISNVNTTVNTFNVTDAAGKQFFYNYTGGTFQEKGQNISEAEFEALIQRQNVRVSVTKSSDDKFTFNILESGTAQPPVIQDVTISAAAATATGNVADKVVVTFSKNVDEAKINLANFTLTNGTVASVLSDGNATDNKVTFSVTGATSLDLGTLTFTELKGLAIDGGDLKAGTVTVTPATASEPVEGVVLSSLAATAYEIQDNTEVDKWGVVLKHDQLPTELQGATSYTITINGETVELTKNRFNSNVFSGQVDSTKFTKAQVEAGTITKNN